MHEQHTRPARRRLLLAAAGLATAALPGVAAARLATPQQMRGPFYPDRMPLDQDNDLTRLMDGAPSRGEITDLSGRVLGLDGMPVKDALVEIWQCDANGRYIHSGDEGGRPRDPGFQGYGKTRSGSDYGGPTASGREAKQRAIRRAASAYLSRHGLWERPARFDVVTIHRTAGPPWWAVRHYRDAFRAEGAPAA